MFYNRKNELLLKFKNHNKPGANKVGKINFFERKTLLINDLAL
jgi:hypothetical protein